jgi:hypothetical protein
MITILDLFIQNGKICRLRGGYPLFLNSHIKRARNIEKEKVKDEELLKRKIPVDRLYTGKRIKRLP